MSLPFAFPTHHFHAGIVAGAQCFNHGASTMAATQNVDPLAEYAKPDNALVSPTPEDEKNGKN